MAKLWIVLALLCGAKSYGEPPPAVSFVTSSHRHVRALSPGDLRRIFLGQISRWDDGHRIVLLVRPSTTPEGRTFLRHVIHMSAIDYAQWWIGAIFRGDAAAAPRVMDSEEAMFKAVTANPDAIGYVRSFERSPSDVAVVPVITP
jgi:ABC-type phosphate transport system substrate-binding protein